MITVACRVHPRYKAVRPPRCECKACADLYALRKLLTTDRGAVFAYPHKFLQVKS